MTDILKPEHLAVAGQKINALSAKLLDMQHIAEHGADPQAVQADFDKAVGFYTSLLTNPPALRPSEPAQKPAEFDPSLPLGGLGGFWPKTNHDLVAANPRIQHDLAVMKDLSAPLQRLPLDALRRLREEVIPKLFRFDAQRLAAQFTVGDLKGLIEAREHFGRCRLEQDMRRAAKATMKEVELDLSPGEDFLSTVCPYRFLLMSAASGEVDRVNALAFELEKAQRKLAAGGLSVAEEPAADAERPPKNDEEDGSSPYVEINLAERTLTVGKKKVTPSNKVWNFLKTLADTRQHGMTYPKPEDSKNPVDMLRKKVGKENLPFIFESTPCGYKLAPKVTLKDGSQMNIRQTKQLR